MISARTGLVFVVLALSTSQFAAAQARRRPEPKKPAESSVPWPYTKVIRGIEGITAGDWKEDEVVKDILRSKVDFPVTEEIKTDLRKHGASEHLIETIAGVSPALPAPPPKRSPLEIYRFNALRLNAR